MEIEDYQREVEIKAGANGHLPGQEAVPRIEVNKEEIGTSELFLSVVIPAYNEERRLPESLATVLEWLDQQSYRSEVLIVDDGSEDATVEVVQKAIAQRQDKEKAEETGCHLQLVANEHRGKAYAVRSGMLQGQGRYILFSDADFSTPIVDTEKLLAWLEQGYDVAIGSREGQEAHRYDEPFYRHLMGRVFNLLVRTMTFSGFQDTQCGFKAFTRAAAQDLFKSVQLYGENSKKVKGAMVTGFDVEVLFLARKKGYKVREVPVQWYHVGGSKVSPIKDSLRMVGDVLKVRLNDLRGLYR
jgi:dolichyl-phosphate beta-glucosyltransferase